MYLPFGLDLEFMLFTKAFRKYVAPKIAGPIIIAASLLAAPVLMASQNWDDHDSSKNILQLQWQKHI